MGVDTEDYSDDIEVINPYIKTTQPSQEKLVRRARLRSLVCNRHDFDTGIATYAELADLLQSTTTTIKNDLEVIGAKKIVVKSKGRKREIFAIMTPTQLKDSYAGVPPDIIENKLSVLFYQNVLGAPLRKGERILVETEECAARLVHLWLCRLSWNEIFVCKVASESLVEVECVDEESAKRVLARFTVREFS